MAVSASCESCLLLRLDPGETYSMVRSDRVTRFPVRELGDIGASVADCSYISPEYETRTSHPVLRPV